MLKREIFSILRFKAISPIYAGSGMSITSVDLPIQRERHTGWPHIQASSVKGALRDHFRKFSETKGLNDINYIFGSDEHNDKEKEGSKNGLASSISVSDAKILFFPMRSNVAPFVYVTCPSVLKRLANDLKFIGMEKHVITNNIPVLKEYEYILISGKIEDAEVLLEDIKVEKSSNDDIEVNEETEFINDLDKIILISDEAFDYCVSSCTEVQTQITIDPSKGITRDGSLRYQELLPSDTVLYSILYISNSTKDDFTSDSIFELLKEAIKDFVQVGGDETLGRGICQINWIDTKNMKKI